MASTEEKKTSEPGEAYGFFYGTLMAPEVFFTVCYQNNQPIAAVAKQHVFREAVLHGYSRHRIQKAEYPGIIPDSEGETPQNSVRGMLVGGLTSANIHHLDQFEGDEYDRREVSVFVDGEKEPVRAQVYVFKYPSELERREWDFEEFRREKMTSWTRADLTFQSYDDKQPATDAK